MENESPNSAAPSTTSSVRQTSASVPMYGGIPDRQTVQVIQQALTRQPSTAAQYLQQMYAAQQQHLMLQSAALQQQHLTSAQLQSLAAAQQASLAASRTSPVVSVSQPPAQVNVTSSAQIIQRCQGVSSVPPAASGISQQAVLLGNPASPALSPSQAQMYLRAQMLIFTPTAAVSSIQSDTGSGAASQVQNLALRGPGQGPLPSLNLHPLTSISHTKPTGLIQGDSGDPHKKGGSQGPESRGITRTVLPASTHSIITPAFSSQLVPQKQIHPTFSLQPSPVLPVTQISSPRQVPLGVPSPPESTGLRPNPVLQLPQQCGSLPAQRRLLPSTSAVILQIPAARTMDTHTRCAPPNRPLAVSPSQGHIQPQPSPIAQAAISITGTSDLQNPQLHDSSQPCQPDPHPCPPLDMTSGNGSSPLPAAATGSTSQPGENKPPQAVVKPQILTHVIEGFVIQEGAQPFPSHRRRAVLQVERSSPKYPQPIPAEKLPQQDNNTTTTDSEMETFTPESKNEGDPPKLKCELCGRVDFEYKFKRSKRFCSMACAKRYNVGCTKRVGLFHPDRSRLQKPGAAKHGLRRSRKVQNHGPDPVKQVTGSIVPSLPISAPSSAKHPNSQEDSSRCSDNSSLEEPLSPVSAGSSLSQQHCKVPELQTQSFLPSDATKWNVEEVYGFIRSLPGCQEISEEFRAQEIDGQALLLLKEDHLMSAMNIKLGPALKIYARISKLKEP